MGYRHFDTAQIYGSEAALGNALNDAISNGVVRREELFVTSKLWGSHHHDPVSALQKTLKYVWIYKFMWFRNYRCCLFFVIIGMCVTYLLLFPYVHII